MKFNLSQTQKVFILVAVAAYILLRFIFTPNRYTALPPAVSQIKFPYLIVNDCAQRIPMFKDTSLLYKYGRLYQKEDYQISDGIFLRGHPEYFLNPYDTLYVLSKGVLKNGLVYYHCYQKGIRIRRYKNEGYVFQSHCQSANLDSTYTLCNEYLGSDWESHFGASPGWNLGLEKTTD